jgi:tellurite resistance protein TerC
MELLFPLDDYWWFYLGFSALVLGLLAVDLGVFHRRPHAVSLRESLAWSVFWVALALTFGFGLYLYAAATFGPEAGRAVGLEFLTGYLVEKSLAIDNIFVFALVFAYFAIPAEHQHRVLFYGIVGALGLRAIFIAMGSVLMRYEVVVYLFGAFLLLTGVKMLWSPERKIHPERNPVIRLLRRLLPITPDFHNGRFLVRVAGPEPSKVEAAGRWHATPLLVALVFLELSDILFAVDSVPAIFAITREPLLVFTSNILAILGLRAMYFLLASAIERFHLLKYALALILLFVGLKMVWLDHAFGGRFPIQWSLGIIAALFALAVLGSILRPPRIERWPVTSSPTNACSSGSRREPRC